MNAKSRKALLSFIFWSRHEHGYASDAKGTKLAMGGREFRCSRGKFSYWDQFWCFDPFIGQEMISHDNQGWVWGMNYYGVMLKVGRRNAGVSAEETYMFLKQAILKFDAAAPYRGPKNFTDGEGGDWVYENEWEPWSTLERFCGTERIFRKGILVYRGDYHGGLIKGK